MLQLTVSSAASKIPEGTADHATEPTPAAIWPAVDFADIATRGERVIVAMGGSTVCLEDDAHVVGKICAFANELEDARITLLNMCAERRGMRPQYLHHVRVEGVVGEEVLRGSGEQSRSPRPAAQRRASRSRLAGLRATTDEASAHGQPAQRVQRSGEHVDAGQVDGERVIRCGAVDRRGDRAVPGLAEHPPQPVRTGRTR